MQIDKMITDHPEFAIIKDEAKAKVMQRVRKYQESQRGNDSPEPMTPFSPSPPYDRSPSPGSDASPMLPSPGKLSMNPDAR